MTQRIDYATGAPDTRPRVVGGKASPEGLRKMREMEAYLRHSGNSN